MSKRLKTCLTSGRAPAYWQRQIAQDTAWLNSLTRCCAWLTEITDIRVTLNETPLLGQSLVALTTQLSQQNSTGREATHPASAISRGTSPAKHEHKGNSNLLTRSQAQESRFPGEINEAYEPPSTETKRGVAQQSLPGGRRLSHQVTELERQVAGVLLRRWAGESVQENSGDSSRSRSTALSGQRRWRNGSIRPLSGQYQRPSQHDWQETLVKRANHLLGSAHLPAGRAGTQEKALHAQLWGTPLTIDGATAPTELLLRLTNAARESDTMVNGEAEQRASSLRPGGQAGGKPAVAGAGSLDERAHGRSISPQATPLEDADLHNQGLLKSLLADAQIEPIMQPVVAPQLPVLPPLTVPRQVDIPPQPAAEATLRLGARAEMMIEDDLDVLAAKIKRILDDEARRHGIDV